MWQALPLQDGWDMRQLKELRNTKRNTPHLQCHKMFHVESKVRYIGCCIGCCTECGIRHTTITLDSL